MKNTYFPSTFSCFSMHTAYGLHWLWGCNQHQLKIQRAPPREEQTTEIKSQGGVAVVHSCLRCRTIISPSRSDFWVDISEINHYMFQNPFVLIGVVLGILTLKAG